MSEVARVKVLEFSVKEKEKELFTVLIQLL